MQAGSGSSYLNSDLQHSKKLFVAKTLTKLPNLMVQKRHKHWGVVCLPQNVDTIEIVKGYLHLMGQEVFGLKINRNMTFYKFPDEIWLCESFLPILIFLIKSYLLWKLKTRSTLVLLMLKDILMRIGQGTKKKTFLNQFFFNLG